MISGVGPTLSSMEAHKKKMDVTANNVANIYTDGFKKSRVVLHEGARGDVVVDIQKIETPGHTVEYSGESEEVIRTETSNVDYAEEAVNMVIAQRGFQLNLKVLQTEDEILGSLLDIKT